MRTVRLPKDAEKIIFLIKELPEVVTEVIISENDFELDPMHLLNLPPHVTHVIYESSEEKVKLTRSFFFATIYYERQDTEKAAYYFNQHLQFHPNDKVALTYMANIKILENKSEEALSIVLDLLQTDPTYSFALMSAAKIYLDRFEGVEAFEYLWRLQHQLPKVFFERYILSQGSPLLMKCFSTTTAKIDVNPSEKNCGICIENFSTHQDMLGVKISQCSYSGNFQIYHRVCLFQWLIRKEKDPNTNLPIEDIVQIEVKKSLS